MVRATTAFLIGAGCALLLQVGCSENANRMAGDDPLQDAREARGDEQAPASVQPATPPSPSQNTATPRTDPAKIPTDPPTTP